MLSTCQKKEHVTDLRIEELIAAIESYQRATGKRGRDTLLGFSVLYIPHGYNVFRLEVSQPLAPVVAIFDESVGRHVCGDIGLDRKEARAYL